MNNERVKKLLLLTLSNNDNEALSALRLVQKGVDWHKLVDGILVGESQRPKVQANYTHTYTQEARPYHQTAQSYRSMTKEQWLEEMRNKEQAEWEAFFNAKWGKL